MMDCVWHGRRGNFGLCRAAAWFVVSIAVLLLSCTSTGAAADTSPAASPEQILQYLDRTIDWYRSLSALAQSPVTTAEVIYRNSVRQSSRQVLQLAFDFARAQATILSATKPNAPSSAPTTSTGGRTLAQAAVETAQHLAQLQAQLAALNESMKSATQGSFPVLSAKRDKLASDIALVTAQRDVIQNMLGLETENNGGLLEKINDLERTVADAAADKQAVPGAVPSAADASTDLFRPDAAGIFGLITEMFSMSRRMILLRNVSEEASALRQLNESLRLPVRTELVDAIRRGKTIEATPTTDDISKLRAESAELDTLSGRFKQLAAAGVPIREQSLLIESTRANLLQWRNAIEWEFSEAVKYLAFRLGGMALAVLTVLGFSWLWRRATFRYIGDVRRRRQFLVVRRIVVGSIITLIVIASFVTEFGSLATYAGILTAGIAVALQTVLLSGVAYFFVIGRYGIRVGDRVTVANITGDVVDIGLFRLYLLELSASGPTGRIVVFSNSVLFQPSPFFKQIPGSDYVWHQVALTLTPESSHELAEKRLLDAVNSVVAEYSDVIEQQHAAAQSTLHLQTPPPHPEGRLRFVDDGLEYVVRYPVEIRRASEIDDRITRRLLDAIETEPKLRLVSSKPPTIQTAPA